MDSKEVKTRFAPSPTGLLHLGVFRTAIFAYLFAKKNGGKFVLRIEDTDKERSKKEFEDDIIESMKWLDIPYDEFYRQSEHVGTHKKYLEKMITDGTAYISREEAKDGSGQIKEIVRFKNPKIDITFTDLIKGEVTIHTEDLGDFVIAKNLHEPLFHLAVVVDDFEEGITHVIRGEDHVSNTPRQILIQRAIGAPTPMYAHLPLVFGPDKQKLSKRRGARSASEYKALGFLPEAILNGTAFVGWNPGTEKEIFTHDELIAEFDISRVQKAPAVFNEEKLEWFNKMHMKNLSPEEIEKNILENLPENFKNLDGEVKTKIVPVIFDRISKWSDVKKMIEAGELNFVFSGGDYPAEKLIFKDTPVADIKANLIDARDALKGIDSNLYTLENIKEVLTALAKTKPNLGQTLHPVRIALSGMDKSPGPFILAYILGQTEALVRLDYAISQKTC